MLSNLSNDLSLQEVRHYLRLNRFHKARTRLFPLLAEDPNDGYLHYLMAVCLWGLDQNEKALESCQEALRYGYSSELCNLILGKAYLELDRYVEAEECFLIVLHDNPQNAEAMATYGFLMMKTRHNQKAEKLLAEALRLDPDDETVLYYNFLHRMLKNRRREEAQFLQRYFMTADSEVKKLVAVGLSNLFRNDHRAARENFRHAFLLEPTNEDLLRLLQEVDRCCHPFFLPLRLVERIGGPVTMWIVVVVSVMVLRLLGQKGLGSAVTLVYLIYVIYSWTVFGIYALLAKRRRVMK